MKYRGTTYELDQTPLDIVEGDPIGCYRGCQVRQHYLKHLPEAGPVHQLRYRGIQYTTERQSSEQLSRMMSEVPVASTIVPLRRDLDGKLTETHHYHLNRNLERRLQLARSQGNATLIQLLEAEREHI